MNEPILIRRYGTSYPAHPLVVQVIADLSGLGITATLEPNDARGLFLEVALPAGQRILIGASDDIPTVEEPLPGWVANCVNADTEFVDDVYATDDPEPGPLVAAVAAYFDAHHDRQPVSTRTVRVRAKKTYGIDVEVPAVLGGDAVDLWLDARHHLWCPDEHARYGYDGEEIEDWAEDATEHNPPPAAPAADRHHRLTAAIWSKVPGGLPELDPDAYDRLERAISHSGVPEALMDVVFAVLGAAGEEDTTA